MIRYPTVAGGAPIIAASLVIGGPQAAVGQVGQITAPFTNVNATADIFRVQYGNLDPTFELGGTTGSFANWAIVGATRIPTGTFTGAAGWPSGGLAGYALTDNPQVFAVGLYAIGGMSSSGTGSSTFGANTVAINTTLQSGISNTGQDFGVMYGHESDVVIKAKAGAISPNGSYVAGYSAILNADIAPSLSGVLSAFLVSTVNRPWDWAFATLAGAATNGILLNQVATSGTTASQLIQMNALSSGTAYAGRFYTDPAAGGVVVQNLTLGPQFIVGNPNNAQAMLSYNAAGSNNILQILNNTVSAGTVSGISLQTGTANSFANLNLTDGSVAQFVTGSAVISGLAFQMGGGGGFSVGTSAAAAFSIDPSVASLSAGFKVTGAVASGTVGLSVTSSAATANLSIDAKGGGTITIAGTSSGAVTVSQAMNVTSVSGTGAFTALSSTAIASGSATQFMIKGSSTSNFGVFFGSGIPSFGAAQGSLYMRSDGSSTATRMYVNQNGSTTWTNVVTAA